MTITTVMTFFVIRYGWKYPLALCIAATGIFFLIDVTFLASNLLKLPHGGWFPLLIGIGVFTLMLTWKQGRKLLSDKLRETPSSCKRFLEAVFINPPTRVAGTAVFLVREGFHAQRAAAQPQAQQGAARPERLRHRKHHEVPWVGFEKRVEVEALAIAAGRWRCISASRTSPTCPRRWPC